MNDSDNDVGSSRLAVKLRRGHKKVKTGCADCRRRRVKVISNLTNTSDDWLINV
jgi:hypothetical protein